MKGNLWKKKKNQSFNALYRHQWLLVVPSLYKFFCFLCRSLGVPTQVERWYLICLGKTALKFPDRVLALKRHIKLNLDFNREKKTSGQSLERVKACAGTLWWALTPFNLLPPRTPRCTAGLMQTLSIFIFVSMSMLILNPTKNSGAKMSLCSSSSV